MIDQGFSERKYDPDLELTEGIRRVGLLFHSVSELLERGIDPRDILGQLKSMVEEVRPDNTNLQPSETDMEAGRVILDLSELTKVLYDVIREGVGPQSIADKLEEHFSGQGSTQIIEATFNEEPI